MADNLAVTVQYKLIYDDFPTIVAALEYFGERAAGPSGGTTVAGGDAFGIEANADVIQRSAQVQVFSDYTGINFTLAWHNLNPLFFGVPFVPIRRFPAENPPISPASKPIFTHPGANHFHFQFGYGGEDGEHELTIGTASVDPFLDADERDRAIF
jgi:hypothetical protein